MSASASVFDFIKLPIAEIEEYLAKLGIELKPTIWADTYLVKFTEITVVNDPEVCRLKGLIFNHTTGQILSMTYPVAIDCHEVSDMKYFQSQPYKLEDAIDGTLMRYAYFPELKQWVLSTVNKEDASDAYWLSQKSFKEQFDEIPDLKLDTTKFDTNHVHLFVMCHPDNINVVAHTKPIVYHTTTYDRTSMTEIECDLGLSKPITRDVPLELIPKITRDDLQLPITSAGIVVVQTHNGITYRYRFEAGGYTMAKKLRGNSNNIDYLLLDLWKNSQLHDFFKYYPMYQSRWQALYHRFTALTRQFFNAYGLKHKQHVFVNLHPRHVKFMGLLHQDLYLKRLRPQRKTVSLPDIGAYMTQQPTANLLYLLNYIYDQPTF